MDDFSQSKFSLPLLEEFSDDEKPILSMSYDRFTKWLFSRLFFARAFFERFLPERILNEIDLDSLELMTSQYVNSEGKTSLSDVCYQVKQKKGGRKTFVILLEHKSSADRGAALQMARYDLDLLDLMFQNPERYADSEGKIPSPYPILFCQEDCPVFDAIVSRLHSDDRYGMSFEYQSVNVNEIDLESLRNIACLFASFSLFRLSKDPIRKDWEKLEKKLLEPFEIIIANCLDSNDQSRYRGILTSYLRFASFFVRSNTKIKRFIDVLQQQEIEKYKGNTAKIMALQAYLDQEIASPFHEIYVLHHNVDEMGRELSRKDELLTQTREQLSQKDDLLFQTQGELSQTRGELSQTRGELSQTREQLSKSEGEKVRLLQGNIVSLLQSRFPDELSPSVCKNVESIKEETLLNRIFQFSLKDELSTISKKLELICL